MLAVEPFYVLSFMEDSTAKRKPAPLPFNTDMIATTNRMAVPLELIEYNNLIFI